MRVPPPSLKINLQNSMTNIIRPCMQASSWVHLEYFPLPSPLLPYSSLHTAHTSSHVCVRQKRGEREKKLFPSSLDPTFFSPFDLAPSLPFFSDVAKMIERGRGSLYCERMCAKSRVFRGFVCAHSARGFGGAGLNIKKRFISKTAAL